MRPCLLPLLAALALSLPFPAQAQNRLANPDFDDDLAGWLFNATDPFFLVEWASQDAWGEPDSGSVRLTDLFPEVIGSVRGLRQCLSVSPGASYDFGTRARIPPGQERTGTAYLRVVWFENTDCTGFLALEDDGTSSAGPGWQLLGREARSVPPGARSAEVVLAAGATEPNGTFEALFDGAYFCVAGACGSAGPPTPPSPDPPYGRWIDSPGLPGFEAQVRVTPAGGSPFRGELESACIPETICARGALEGRPEVFVKVIGPRPNGYLWVQLIRFTPSQVEVWLRQTGTGTVRYYLLESVVPGVGVLSGLEDRQAFRP